MTLAAILYALTSLVVVIFQLALAFGVPWGHLAMGGKYPSVFPYSMRLAAIVQAMLLSGLAIVVLRHAGLLDGGPVFQQDKAVWLAVAVAVAATVMNAITPSRQERRLWLPVAAVMLATSFAVAMGSRGGA